MPRKAPQVVYQIKVTLANIKPPVWRRFQAPGDCTLLYLHEVLQTVMGWYGGHLHQFVIGGEFYGQPDPEFSIPVSPEVVNEGRVRLREVVRVPKTRFSYEYDFGDSWEHTLVVEKILPPEPGVRYPVCLAGQRHCPPEDCGGPWGYADFLKAIAHRKHPEHKELLEWIGGSFDPERFDLDTVNRMLGGGRRRR